jgi:hypothetical protein
LISSAQRDLGGTAGAGGASTAGAGSGVGSSPPAPSPGGSEAMHINPKSGAQEAGGRRGIGGISGGFLRGNPRGIFFFSVVLRGSDLIFCCGYGGGASVDVGEGKGLVAASDASLLLWGGRRTLSRRASQSGGGGVGRRGRSCNPGRPNRL